MALASLARLPKSPCSLEDRERDPSTFWVRIWTGVQFFVFEQEKNFKISWPYLIVFQECTEIVMGANMIRGQPKDGNRQYHFCEEQL